MKIGTKVKVKNVPDAVSTYVGREGVVVAFDPSLPWQSPRALLAPDQFICVHLYPKTKREKEYGSPLALFGKNELRVLSGSTGGD